MQKSGICRLEDSVHKRLESTGSPRALSQQDSPEISWTFWGVPQGRLRVHTGTCEHEWCMTCHWKQPLNSDFLHMVYIHQVRGGSAVVSMWKNQTKFVAPVNSSVCADTLSMFDQASSVAPVAPDGRSVAIICLKDMEWRLTFRIYSGTEMKMMILGRIFYFLFFFFLPLWQTTPHIILGSICHVSSLNSQIHWLFICGLLINLSA